MGTGDPGRDDGNSAASKCQRYLCIFYIREGAEVIRVYPQW